MRITLAVRPQRGLSYLEVLIAISIIAVSVIPVGTALKHSLDVDAHSRDVTERHFLMLKKMEEVLSYSYLELSQDASASLSTRFSDDASADPRRLVYVMEADGDNADADNRLDTGADTELLLIRTEYADGTHRLEALRSRP